MFELTRSHSKHRNLWLVAIALSLGAHIGCQDSDVGRLCGAQSPSFPQDPIEGETPTVEVVQLTRDGLCETFQCLTHAGIPPYCTQSCSQSPVADSDASCDQDSDCPQNDAYCSDGVCVSDDCPQAFRCGKVQDVGPLAESFLCLREFGCQTNFDCGALGEIDCVPLGCFDRCTQIEAQAPTDDGNDAAETCSFHQLACEATETLPCSCADTSIIEGSFCPDADLECRPEGGLPWQGVGDTPAVRQTSACFAKDQQPGIL